MFKQVEVYLNGTQVQDQSSATYGLKSWLETSLSYGKSAKDSFLRTCYFNKDKNGHEDVNISTSADPKCGYMLRKPFVEKSQKIFFITDTFIGIIASSGSSAPVMHSCQKCALKDACVRTPSRVCSVAANTRWSAHARIF